MPKNTPIRELMSYAATISPDDTLRTASKTLQANDVTSLVVRDDNDLVGILTATDIISAVADNRDVDTTHTRECMSEGVVSIAEDASLEQAAELLEVNDIRHLPVLNNQHEVVGKLTTEDVSDRIAND